MLEGIRLPHDVAIEAHIEAIGEKAAVSVRIGDAHEVDFVESGREAGAAIDVSGEIVAAAGRDNGKRRGIAMTGRDNAIDGFMDGSIPAIHCNMDVRIVPAEGSAEPHGVAAILGDVDFLSGFLRLRTDFGEPAARARRRIEQMYCMHGREAPFGKGRKPCVGYR